MKHILTLSLCFLALSLSAQETITYPYNPDGDADGLVAVPDIQDLLAVYGSPFSPAEIMVGDTALSEWIQILSQALEDQQAVIDAMQSNYMSAISSFGDLENLSGVISFENGSVSQEFQASNDGILFGYCTGGNTSSNGQLYIYFDSIPNSTSNSLTINHGSSYYNQKLTFCLPIKKHWYWRIAKSQTGSLSKIFWMPFSSDSSAAESSTSWNSSVPFLQSFHFPQGRIGESVTIDFAVGSSYTVPSGMNLYIHNQDAIGSPEYTISDNLGNSVFMSQDYPATSENITFGEGFTITLTSCATLDCDDSWKGILIDKQYIEAVMIVFSPNSQSYTVPSGKVFVGLSANDFEIGTPSGEWSYNGYVGPTPPSYPIEENVTITYLPNESNPTLPSYMFGYLMNLE